MLKLNSKFATLPWKAQTMRQSENGVQLGTKNTDDVLPVKPLCIVPVQLHPCPDFVTRKSHADSLSSSYHIVSMILSESRNLNLTVQNHLVLLNCTTMHSDLCCQCQVIVLFFLKFEQEFCYFIKAEGKVIAKENNSPQGLEQRLQIIGN